MFNKFLMLILFYLVQILSLEAIEPNRGFKVYGVGLCLIKNICLVSNDEFMYFQLGIIHGRSPGNTMVQISSVYSESYGNNILQAGIFNINKSNENNLNSRDKNFSIFQFGGLNIVRGGDVYGGQFSIAANNLPSKDSESGLPYTKLSPNFTGVQISGGMNTSKSGFGLQFGLDLHWIVFVFDSEKQRYISRAKNIYGVQFHPIAQQIEERLIGIQGSFINNSNSSLGFQFGGINASNKIIGLQGGLINNSSKEILGIQFGLFNASELGNEIQYGLINRSSTMTGIQYGFWNSIDTEFTGLQLGLINSDSMDSTVHGIQFGYLYNSAGRVLGPQVGLYNVMNDCDFVQIGAINIANRNVKGAQIGLYNSTNGKASFQIGLLNHAEKNTLPWFPLVNIDIE